MSEEDNDLDDEDLFQIDDLRKLDSKVFDEDALETPKTSIKLNKYGRFGVSPPLSSSPTGSLVGYHNEDNITKMMKPLVINNPNKNYKYSLSSLTEPYRPLTPDNIKKLEETKEMRKMKKDYDEVKRREKMLNLKSPSYESRKIDKINSKREDKRFKYQMLADQIWQKKNEEEEENRKNLRLQKFQRDLQDELTDKMEKGLKGGRKKTRKKKKKIRKRKGRGKTKKRRRKTHRRRTRKKYRKKRRRIKKKTRRRRN